MSNFDFSSFKGLYLETARDYIKKLRQNLEVLLVQPDNYDAINTIYIAAHSLGSQGTLVGYKNIESVCSTIERIFKKIKEGNLKISQELLTALKDSVIGLTNCVDSIDKENSEIDLSIIKSQLEKV